MRLRVEDEQEDVEMGKEADVNGEGGEPVRKRQRRDDGGDEDPAGGAAIVDEEEEEDEELPRTRKGKGKAR